MSGKKGFGKFVVGAVLVGAAAYGIYQFSRRYLCAGKEAQEPEPDEEATPVPEQVAEEIFEEEDVQGTQEDTVAQSGRYAAVDIKQAADRAYTTIQHGTQEAVDKMMEAVGPKGVGVIEVACETAGEVGKAVADSAVRIYDILTEPGEAPAEGEEAQESAEEIVAAVAPADEVFSEETPADEVPGEGIPAGEIPEEAAAPEEAPAEEVAEAAVEEAEVETVSASEETTISAGEAAEAVEEAVTVAEAAAGEAAAAAEEEVVAAGEAVGEAVTAAAEDMVEEFFDDEEPSDA